MKNRSDNRSVFVEPLENRLLMYAALPPSPSVHITDQETRFYSGDFNNDGRADVLTRNYSDGSNLIFRTISADGGGASFENPVSLKAAADVNWWISAVGDFDNDGKKDDILFRNFWENGKLMFCNALFLVGQ